MLESAEDRKATAVVAHELQRGEPLARQEVEALRAAVALERHHRARGNAPERRVEQKQSFVDREPQGLVGLLQAALGLAAELAGHMGVGNGGDGSDGEERTPDEQQEQAAAESGLERGRRQRHSIASSVREEENAHPQIAQ